MAGVALSEHGFINTACNGQRAVAVMSLIQSAKLNGHNPYAYLKDVLTRVPTQRASQVRELLPHRWQLHFKNHV